MLSYLRIKNFALIDELNIEFERGLNVITGETGAGKSMIIEAINTVLGKPTSANLIKNHCDFLEVEALFNLNTVNLDQLKQSEEVSAILTDQQQMVFRRQVHRKKKNRCWINHHMVTLSLLQKVGNLLIDLHGQHSHQSLLNSESHIDFVDNLGCQSFLQEKEQLSECFYRWQTKKKAINQLLQNRSDHLAKKDYMSFQLREIEEARLKENEDKELEEKINIIRHTVKIKEIMEMSTVALYEGGEEGEPSLRDTLTRIISQFQAISGLDEKIQTIQEQLEETRFKVEDITDQLIEYKDRIDFDSQQLQEFEERLNLINHLKQKYGPKLIDILKYYDQLQEQVEAIEDSQEKIKKLTIEKEEDEKKLAELARGISDQRKIISEKLAKDIIKELKELNMKDCNFMVQMRKIEDESGIKIKENRFRVTPKGIDKIEFFIATNTGERLKPLAEIISGGEVSRIMLGLKSILSHIDDIPTMIFDEIDSGVGARLGEVIAEKLAKIAKNHQVIAVTHLPQIACKANQHLYISKFVANNMTEIEIIKLDGDEQLNEIARMLDGEQYGSISFAHAREMLCRGESSKDAE